MIEVAAGDEPALGAVMVDTVVADGFAVRFEVHGEGIPLVYTPGAFYPLESSRLVADALAPRGYQVVLWDRPNTGGSGLLFEPKHPLRLWADKLAVLLDHLGISSVHAAGVTHGLLASLHFTVRHPARVRGLVLVAALHQDPKWWDAVVESTFLEPARVIVEHGMATALERGEGRWGVFDWPEQFRLAPQKQEQLLAMDPAAAAATLRAWARQLHRDRLALGWRAGRRGPRRDRHPGDHLLRARPGSGRVPVPLTERRQTAPPGAPELTAGDLLRADGRSVGGRARPASAR